MKRLLAMALLFPASIVQAIPDADRERDARRSMNALIGHLPSASVSLRAWIAGELAHHADPRAWPLLVSLAGRDSEDSVRVAAMASLGDSRRPEAVPELHRALEHPSHLVQEAAIRGLGNCQRPQALTLLLELLNDHPLMGRQPRWHKEVIQALDFYRDPEAIPGLMWSLDLPDLNVNRPAFILLLRMGAPAQAALYQWAIRVPPEQEVGHWTYFLSGMHDPSTLDTLLTMVHDPQWPPVMRRSMVHGIGRMPDTRVGLIMVTCMAVEGRVGWVATYALELHPHPGLLEPLGQLLNHPKTELREHAEYVMKKWGAEAFPLMVQGMRNTYADVRESSVEALGTVKTPDALTLLIGGLQDPESFIRVKTARMLASTLEHVPLTPGVPVHGKQRPPQRPTAWTITPASAQALVGALDDPEAAVRLEAVQTLASWHDDLTLYPHADRLKRVAKTDADPAVRDAARAAFSTLGGIKPILTPRSHPPVP